MKDKGKTKKQLMEELEQLRRRVSALEVLEARHMTQEIALIQTNEEKETILDGLMEHVVYHDLEMRVVWANRAACDSVGMSREELRGRHCHRIWNKRSEPCEDCPVQLARDTGQPQTLEKTTPDGRSWYIQAAPVRGASTDIVGMVELTLDISERKLTEEALRQNEELYRQLVETMNEGLAFGNQDYIFTFVNERFCEMLGYPMEEIVGRHLIEFVHDDDKEMMKGQMARRRRGEQEKFEIAWSAKDGRKIYTIASPKGLFDAEGNFTGSLAVLTDITVRRQLEEALRKAHLEAKRGLENLVEKRTVELVRVNEQLHQEIEEREQAEKHIGMLSQELIKAQEVERQRLAADLHDHLGQDLASLKIGLDRLSDDKAEAPDERRQRVFALSKLAQNSVMAIRDMAYGLHPSSLKEFGLVYTGRQYCAEFAVKNGLTIDFFSVGMGGPKLDFDTEIAFYRMIQEGLTNVQKHADASHVNVRLSATVSHIMLHIEDDGKGFEVNKRLKTALDERRMGIWGMEQRVAFLNGKMNIESGPGDGTRILIKVPYMDKTNG